MLAFAPQAWTSDDTDAVERLRIQWGTSLAYPLSSMGAHVAAVPNHQTGRITPIATRAAVAFFGVFGYELDPTALDRRRPARRSPTRSRSTRPIASCSSAAGSSACAARSRATATRPPGWSSRPTRPRRSSATTRSSTGRCPPPTGCGCAGSTRTPSIACRAGRTSTTALVRANAGPRGGDELMRVGLSLGADRHEAGAWGDFRVLAVRPRGGVASHRAATWCVAVTHLRICDIPSGPIRTILITRDGAHAPRGDDAQRRLACASENGHDGVRMVGSTDLAVVPRAGSRRRDVPGLLPAGRTVGPCRAQPADPRR